MPLLPDPDLQLRWNGASGLELLTQGKVFYRLARAAVAARHGASAARARRRCSTSAAAGDG